MSWNIATQFQNLKQAYLNLSTTALTNPMEASLNMNGFVVNNCNQVNSQTGNPLLLQSTNEVKTNDPLVVNNKVVITNSGTDDCLAVYDSIGSTQIFRVNTDGKVGVKVSPTTTLTEDFTVNGTISATNLVNSVNVINPLVKTGTSANPVISLEGTYVNSITAGQNITLTGTASNPIINSKEFPSPSNVVLIGDEDYSFVDNIALLQNSVITHNAPLSSLRRIFMPNAVDLKVFYNNTPAMAFDFYINPVLLVPFGVFVLELNPTPAGTTRHTYFVRDETKFEGNNITLNFDTMYFVQVFLFDRQVLPGEPLNFGGSYCYYNITTIYEYDAP